MTEFEEENEGKSAISSKWDSTPRVEGELTEVRTENHAAIPSHDGNISSMSTQAKC